MPMMARKLLAAAEIAPNWDSLAGALEGVLRFLGEPATAPWVMGVTGRAFRLLLPIAGSAIAETGSGAVLDLEQTAPLLRNLGRKVEIVAARAGARDYHKRRDEAVKHVRSSIDHGIPAVVYDLHLPAYGIVKGYDDRAGVWYVSTIMSGQYGEALPLNRWPVPERPAPVLAVLLSGRVKVEPRRAVTDGLRFAADHAERGPFTDEAVSGFAAYERWRQAFYQGEPVPAATNAALVQELQSARRDAAAFLRGAATRALPDAAALLARAAAAYDAEVLAVSRMMTMFPYPSGGNPANPAARLVAVAALRDALMHEREAIAALREALAGQDAYRGSRC
jgi:hypothetical protein